MVRYLVALLPCFHFFCCIMTLLNRLSQQLRIWWLPLSWAVLIFWLSSQSTLPGMQVSIYDFILKKSAHMIAYAILYALTFRSLSLAQPELKPKDWRVWLLAFLLCFLYAVSDEVHQAFTPSRTPSPRDVGYDLLGMSVAFLKLYKFI